MISSLFTVLLLSFSCLYFILGYISSRTASSSADYFLAGRNLGLLSVTFTLIATQLGGGMLLGTSQEAYTIGFFGILYTLAMSLGFLILGLGLASRLQSLQVATTAELFQTRYNSVTLKKVASILSILTLLGLLIGQIVASRSIISSIGITNQLVFIIFWLLVIAQTMIGGLQSVVITDFYQVLYIIICFGSLFAYCIWQNPASLLQVLPTSQSTATFLQTKLSIASIINILVMPALFSLIEQDLAQRFFAARTKKIAALSALLASAFMICFSLIPIYFGIQAKALALAIDPQASPLIPVIGYLTNNFVVALALCGIIAAISSTADSLLCAISSNVTQDFDMSALGFSKTVTSSRILTSLIGISAVCGSYLASNNIIGVLIGSYELSVSCLLIPLLVAYFKERVNTMAAYAAIFGGLTGFIIFKLFPVAIPPAFIALAMSGIGFMLAHVIWPQELNQ